MIDGLREWSHAYPQARRLLREGWGTARRVARAARLPVPFDPAEFLELRQVGESAGRFPAQSSGSVPRMLFLSMRGWSTHILWEATFAHAARLAGVEPVFATCGGRLPICDAANAHSAPPMPCISCGEYAESALRLAGFNPYRLKDLVDLGTEIEAAKNRVSGMRLVKDCEGFVDDGLPLGKLVHISVGWFLARGTLPETQPIQDTYRRFLVSGQVLHRAFAQLLDKVEPERVFCLNGTFFPEAILGHLCQARGIQVCTYERGFMTDSVVVASSHPAADLVIEPGTWSEAAERPLTNKQRTLLADYLDARQKGEDTVDTFWTERVEDTGLVRASLDLPPGRPLVALFSNIVWDSAVQGKDIGFESLSDWVLKTIAGFSLRPDVDLVVRLHPAETMLRNHRTRERLADVIAERFGILPVNIRVVPPNSKISSYTLMGEASLGLVYTSTVGLEMATRGIPVVVAAKTHYRGRGFTHDVDTPEEYWRVIDALLMSGATAAAADPERQLSLRYAYLFFFRFMQQVELVHDAGHGRPHLMYTDVDQLEPGRNQTLDRIVDGIKNGRTVVTP